MAVGGKKKGKLGLIIGLVVVLLLIAAGAVAGLAFMGKINIPGITPKKKAAPPLEPTKKAEVKPKSTALPKEKTETPPEKPKEPAPTTKVVDKKGAKKLAEIWNEMPADGLLKLAEKWNPQDLAMVLNEMDSEKVAQLLVLMKPETASKVSQELKRVASLVPIEAQ